MNKLELSHTLSKKYFFTVDEYNCGVDCICNFDIIDEIIPTIERFEIVHSHYIYGGIEYDTVHKINYINYKDECKNTGNNIDMYWIEWNERVNIVFTTEEDAFYFKLKYM